MLFVVDFDGTISKRDTIDQLLEKFADPSWEELEKDWLDGKMTALECMSKQIDMVDSDLLSLENFFRSIQLDESFLPFYEHVKKFAKLVIASDGLDHPIKVATRQAGWPDIQTFSNRLNYKERGIGLFQCGLFRKPTHRPNGVAHANANRAHKQLDHHAMTSTHHGCQFYRLTGYKSGRMSLRVEPL